MEIPDSLDPYIQNHDAFLLRNHGALTVGCNLQKAFFVMEEVEFNAVICKHAMDLGAVHEIGNEQLKKLMELRKKMNLPGRHPGIDYGEEASCNCNNAELVEMITKKVLAALGKYFLRVYASHFGVAFPRILVTYGKYAPCDVLNAP